MVADLELIKVLSFDLDDTLWDGHKVIISAEQAMHDWMLQHTPDVFRQYTKDELRAHKIRFIKQNPQYINKISDGRIAYLSHLFLQLNYPDYQKKAIACFQQFYLARQQVELFDGVIEALQTLQKHYRLIAITNGNADIKLTGLSDYFEFSLNAEDFAKPKPHADIFHAALAKAQVIPKQCLHIGDHPVHDMLGAHQMGMATCWLKDGTREWDQDFSAQLQINHVSELVSLLGKQ